MTLDSKIVEEVVEEVAEANEHAVIAFRVT